MTKVYKNYYFRMAYSSGTGSWSQSYKTLKEVTRHIEHLLDNNGGMIPGEVYNEAMYYLAETGRKTIPADWLKPYEPEPDWLLSKEQE